MAADNNDDATLCNCTLKIAERKHTHTHSLWANGDRGGRGRSFSCFWWLHLQIVCMTIYLVFIGLSYCAGAPFMQHAQCPMLMLVSSKYNKCLQAGLVLGALWVDKRRGDARCGGRPEVCFCTEILYQIKRKWFVSARASVVFVFNQVLWGDTQMAEFSFTSIQSTFKTRKQTNDRQTEIIISFSLFCPHFPRSSLSLSPTLFISLPPPPLSRSLSLSLFFRVPQKARR